MAAEYTSRANLVGVVTNGTAVLGLGDIGPLAGKPVMEGKGCLFKKFAGIDVFDIELAERDPDKLVDIIAALEPTLGGINLEDIKAPECFYIERKLRERMRIPVFHDDQHGTAIISTAAMVNGLELVGKQIGDIKVAVSGAGAAAIACLDLMIATGVKPENVFVSDSRGVLHEGRAGALDESKRRYVRKTDARKLADVMKDADVFLGCSAPGVVDQDMVRSMARQPILLALANPEPEIRPELALEARPDCIIATGRSDYPNQVNNVLCFPYIFRGALDSGASRITEEMKLACMKEIAELTKAEISDEVAAAYPGQELMFGADYIIPKPFDSRLILRIAPAVAEAAVASGVAMRPIADMDDYRRSLSRFVTRTGMFMRPVFDAAKAAPKRIIYADGEDERVLRTAQEVLAEGLAKPILIGRPAHRLRSGRSRGRSALSRVLGGIPPSPRPPRRAAGIRQDRPAPLQHRHRRDDGPHGRWRRHDLRAGRTLRGALGAPQAHPRSCAGCHRAGHDERADAAHPHAVRRRYLRQRGSKRPQSRQHRAHGRQ
jgi:malate dehydrogenase (oxaloacetate-decarboxylating)(NADP+)